MRSGSGPAKRKKPKQCRLRATIRRKATRRVAATRVMGPMRTTPEIRQISQTTKPTIARLTTTTTYSMRLARYIRMLIGGGYQSAAAASHQLSSATILAGSKSWD